ncbi:hypothetical protein HOO34_03040 [Aliarcobacter cryaerophilus]|uniref:Uncharacterized protein n=1 Tax=Aliarcobacter cryaerophilus TaxID=28198 RepID=A0A7G9LQ16_9BACT|nr:hypothetical protein [Aliarcobacter cryaerophilus]QNM90715.1 hypothetical protein HOO34_03040 [Aliarcobacter cryaerophilus]
MKVKKLKVFCFSSAGIVLYASSYNFSISSSFELEPTVFKTLYFPLLLSII